MPLAWIGHPLAYYGCLLVGLALCLALFIGVKLEKSGAARSAERRQKEIEQRLAELLAELEGLRARVEESEERAGALVPPTPARSGLNLNTRAQAIRLDRRRNTPAQIAAILGLPAGEVDLLLKVHRLAARQDEAATQPS
jgi:hypothetical protein